MSVSPPTLDVVTQVFQEGYLRKAFGYGSKHLKGFLEILKKGVLCYIDDDGKMPRQMLYYSCLDNSESGNS